MAKASWTYELPPWRSDPKGLDRYVVEAASGEEIGTVATTVRHDGRVYVVVEGGTPPISTEHHAVPWELVESVDHPRQALRLSVGTDAVEDALELDPDKGVAGPDAGADAPRVTELPEPLRPDAAPAERGPVQRPLHFWVVALTALGVLTFLLAVVVATTVGSPWQFALFVVPAAFFAAALVAGYNVYRRPHRRDLAGKQLPAHPAEQPRERRDARPPG